MNNIPGSCHSKGTGDNVVAILAYQGTNHNRWFYETGDEGCIFCRGDIFASFVRDLLVFEKGIHTCTHKKAVVHGFTQQFAQQFSDL